MRYIVNGEELHFTGWSGSKEVYFFTRPTKEKNELVEIPFTFSGQISLAQDEPLC